MYDYDDAWEQDAEANNVGDLDALSLQFRLAETMAKAQCEHLGWEWDDDYEAADDEDEIWMLLEDGLRALKALHAAGLIRPHWYEVLDERGLKIAPVR